MKIDWKNPDYLPVIEERNDRLLKIKQDPKLLSACFKHYQTNPIDFINDWAWTYDPRRDDPFAPFILFPKQEELVTWLHDRMTNKEDGLIEKSRDMGITWVCCAYSLWGWLFKDGIKFSFGSRKEKLVDELGNQDSIFEKIRIMLRMLPPEFLPTFQDQLGSWMTYKEDRDATHLRILNRANGATIAGEAGDNIGRGGRSTMYFKDEAAFYERPERIEAALSQNSDVKIDLSTYNGNGNVFYRKRFSGHIPVFSFPWRDDPRKDDKWYAYQKRTLEPFILAQEVDMDPDASVENICISPEWVRACVDFCEKFNIEPSGQKISGLDVADEGGDLNAHISRHGIKTMFIDAWAEGSTGQSMIKCYSQAEEQGVEIINYDNIGVGAGTKSKAKEITESKPNPIAIKGINAGSTELIGNWEPDKTNKDMFLNYKALMWWTIKRRAKKTWEWVEGIEKHPIDELLSIPNHPDLIRELSQPKSRPGENGKIQIEPKTELAKRGIKSHNYADALMLAYAPSMKLRGGTW